ncbi:hypothetical protein WA026_020871 [Henosepilachna vigintioctopunctata]|uniref:WD repeat-containing protein 55 homolog n=1 Tax=Henosepilachna vigintioctopunctata TaxID=420089 RepID=A0AAW1UH04_9CUCU
MNSCSVHHIRFYKPKPKAIYCMCLQPNRKLGYKLALSRSDASIEIWNINQSPYIERTISSNVENYTIEGLGWFQDRLFSVGLHGLLVEYSLLKLCIVNRTSVTGEAAFCLDINEKNRQIAVGTEQGYLNIFDITEDNIIFNKFLDKQEGRILCLKYDSTGSFVISGGLDAIRIWNVSSGHALHKMTTGRSEANNPTIVWCLAVTQDFTIISGDSRGKLTFWDGKIGAQIESYQSHRNHILSLCLSEDQTNLYCSGVDSNIVNFVKIQMKNGKEKWVKSIHKKIHNHDVRALILTDGKLYSGGTDAYLALSYNQPKTLIQYPPILQNPCITICKEARLIMLRYPKYIEVWSLGETDEVVQSTNIIPLKKEPKKLIVLQRIVKNHCGDHKKEGIIFADMSDNGKWIAYGTCLGLRVFQFIYENDENPQLLRVENTGDRNEVHLRGVFTPDSSQLITALSDGSIRIYDISDASLSISRRLDCEELTDTITFLCVSDDGSYLVAADPASNTVVWKKNNDSWNFYCKLPKYSCAPTTMALHPTNSSLLIAYSDSKNFQNPFKNPYQRTGPNGFILSEIFFTMYKQIRFCFMTKTV